MALEIFHHGRLLTPEQLEVYSELMVSGAFEGKSLKRTLKLFDAELADRNLSVPALKVGDPVSWETKGVQDKGAIVEFDERAGKIRVMSRAKGRPFWVPEAYIKVLESRKEVPHEA